MLQPSECALHSAISMRFQISRTSSEIWAKDRPASGQAELLPKREITRHTPHNATTHRHYLCWTWSWRASQTHANSLPMTLRLWGTTARRSVQQHIVASASMVANHTASGSSCGMLWRNALPEVQIPCLASPVGAAIFPSATSFWYSCQVLSGQSRALDSRQVPPQR